MSSYRFGRVIQYGGPKMQLSVVSIDLISESRFTLTLKVNSDIIIGHITERSDGEMAFYNIDEEFFNGLFQSYGIDRRFNEDYWAFRAGKKADFPWCYGEYPDELIE